MVIKWKLSCISLKITYQFLLIRFGVHVCKILDKTDKSLLNYGNLC